MTYLCVFEDEGARHFAPLVHLRPVYGLRLGRRNLQDRLCDAFPGFELSQHARPLIRPLLSQALPWPQGASVLFVNGRWLPEPSPLLDSIRAQSRPGEPGRVFVQHDVVVAAWVPHASPALLDRDTLSIEDFDGLTPVAVAGATLMRRLWDLLDGIRDRLREDAVDLPASFSPLSQRSDVLTGPVHLADEASIWVSEGVQIAPGAILNAQNGPIVLDHNASVREGAIVRGPVYLGPNGTIKPRGDIEGSAFGRYCKVGGEVHDVIFQSYSNKGHEGFMGHSYLGNWCNLGAGTSISNLRNDYGPVSLFNAHTGQFEDSSHQFLGLFMGDHSKTSILSAFNTGTVVGVNCNLFDAGFHDRHIPSFSWGRPGAYVPYRLSKAIRVAQAVMARRGRHLNEAEMHILQDVFDCAHAAAVIP